MSFSANRVIIAGNLVRDPESRQVGVDRSVAHFTIAINNRYKTTDGELKDSVVFMDCEAWGRQGELVCQYLAKGSGAYLEGRLKQDNWQDKDGQRRSRIKVVVDLVRFTGTPRQGTDEGEPDQEGGATTSTVPQPSATAAPRSTRQTRAPAPATAQAGAGDHEPPF